jgi:hypothetical protein
MKVSAKKQSIRKTIKPIRVGGDSVYEFGVTELCTIHPMLNLLLARQRYETSGKNVLKHL